MQTSSWPASEEKNGQPGEILVVEDDPTIRYFENIALQRHHFPVVLSQNSQEAIRHLKNRPGICAVVLDLITPTADGFAVISYVRDVLSEIPIVVMTALNPDELEGVDRRVVKQVLFKPIDMETLIADVSALCAPPNGLSDRIPAKSGAALQGEAEGITCPECGQEIPLQSQDGSSILEAFRRHGASCRHRA